MAAHCSLPCLLGVLSSLCLALTFEFVSSESESISGAVNQSVTFHIPSSAPLHEILWTKNKDKVVEWDHGSQQREFSPFKGRIHLDTVSGTLIISNLSSSDEGVYEFDNTKQKFSLSVFEPLPSPALNYTQINDSITVRCWISESYQSHLENVKFSWSCSEPKCATSSTAEIQFEMTEKLPQEICCIVSNPFFQANSSVFLSVHSSAPHSRNRLFLLSLIPVLFILGAGICICKRVTKSPEDYMKGNVDQTSESLQKTKPSSNMTEGDNQGSESLQEQKADGDVTEDQC